MTLRWRGVAGAAPCRRTVCSRGRIRWPTGRLYSSTVYEAVHFPSKLPAVRAVYCTTAISLRDPPLNKIFFFFAFLWSHVKDVIPVSPRVAFRNALKLFHLNFVVFGGITSCGAKTISIWIGPVYKTCAYIILTWTRFPNLLKQSIIRKFITKFET